jgi:Cys-tRNA(Pro)/Cys-tRNA(Cys) deacylase
MTQKTIAMRVLDGKRVPYRVLEYPASERDAERIAAILRLQPGEVFKTLVVSRPFGKPILAMIPSNGQLDLKKLAKAVGQKKLAMASHKDAESLTGLQVGGISPLALINRGFDVFLDRSGADLDQIVISAGQKGLQVQLPVADLIRLTRARIVDAAA